MAYGSEPIGQRAVVAAEYPIKIGREPGRPLRGIVWSGRTADRDGVRVSGVHREQPFEPVRRRFGVIVEERDDVRAGQQQRGIARRTQSAGEPVGDDQDFDGRVGPAGAPFLLAPGEQLIVVIDDDDQLPWDDSLREHGLNRPCEKLPSSQGVGADDNIRARRGCERHVFSYATESKEASVPTPGANAAITTAARDRLSFSMTGTIPTFRMIYTLKTDLRY